MSLAMLSSIRAVGRLARGVHDWFPVRGRHCIAVRISGKPTIIEVWSDEEFARLPVAYKPDTVFVLPGVGWLAFRKPESKQEVHEIRDECERAAGKQWNHRDDDRP